MGTFFDFFKVIAEIIANFLLKLIFFRNSLVNKYKRLYYFPYMRFIETEMKSSRLQEKEMKASNEKIKSKTDSVSWIFV